MLLKNGFLFKLIHKAISFAKKMEENIRQKRANETIVHLQNELIPLVTEMRNNNQISFTTVQAVGAPGGNYWEPVKNIKGDYICKTFNANPDWTMETSKKIADDYQKVIAEYFKRSPERTGNRLEDGKNWVFGNLLKWGGSIVEEGLMSHQEITELANAFEEAIEQKGENFFGYFHGNIIGDHIYVGENRTFYLLGVRIVPRPGKEYYDFLRALDWLILKTDNQVTDFNRIVAWMRRYLGQYDWEEIKLVFALRCIGILGWDILHRGDFGKGDTEAKKNILLKFIRREY
jgi:hypothetical protein